MSNITITKNSIIEDNGLFTDLDRQTLQIACASANLARPSHIDRIVVQSCVNREGMVSAHVVFHYTAEWSAENRGRTAQSQASLLAPEGARVFLEALETAWTA